MNNCKQLIVLLILTLLAQVAIGKENKPIAIAIHGGAGTILKEKLTPSRESEIRQTLKAALMTGYKILKTGESSENAVVKAIQHLEKSSLFNAGVGAVYTYEQAHELDASIMVGHTKQAGAVAGVRHIESPIALASEVMHHSEHVFLSGTGAEEFAWTRGFTKVDNSVFDTPHRLQQLKSAQAKQTVSDSWFSYEANKFGTVGAVALDNQGHIAAGTSTGGMTNKRWGRIGDSPVIGAGTYATPSCGISATGHGEYFIRANVASDICARAAYQNISVEKAADTVINQVLVKMGGTGGVITINDAGDVSMPFNTPGMYRASIDTKGNVTIAIFKK